MLAGLTRFSASIARWGASGARAARGRGCTQTTSSLRTDVDASPRVGAGGGGGGAGSGCGVAVWLMGGGGLVGVAVAVVLVLVAVAVVLDGGVVGWCAGAGAGAGVGGAGAGPGSGCVVAMWLGWCGGRLDGVAVVLALVLVVGWRFWSWGGGVVGGCGVVEPRRMFQVLLNRMSTHLFCCSFASTPNSAQPISRRCCQEINLHQTTPDGPTSTVEMTRIYIDKHGAKKYSGGKDCLLLHESAHGHVRV
jgi:hypothetical protein